MIIFLCFKHIITTGDANIPSSSNVCCYEQHNWIVLQKVQLTEHEIDDIISSFLDLLICTLQKNYYEICSDKRLGTQVTEYYSTATEYHVKYILCIQCEFEGKIRIEKQCSRCKYSMLCISCSMCTTCSICYVCGVHCRCYICSFNIICAFICKNTVKILPVCKASMKLIGNAVYNYIVANPLYKGEAGLSAAYNRLIQQSKRKYVIDGIRTIRLHGMCDMITLLHVPFKTILCIHRTDYTFIGALYTTLMNNWNEKPCAEKS